MMPRVMFAIRRIDVPGGTERFSVNLAAALIRRSCDVRMVTSHDTIPSSVRGLPITNIGIPKMRRWSTICYYVKTFRYLIGKRREYDLIQTFFLKHAAVVGLLAGKLIGKKTICRLAAGGVLGDIETTGRILFGKCLVGFIRKQCDAFVVPGREMKEELIARGFEKEKVFFIPNGVDTELFHLVIPGEREAAKRRLGLGGRRILLYCGRLSPEKGVESLLDGFAAMAKRDVTLVLAGDGCLRGTLEERVRSRGMAASVRFAGFQEDVRDYLRASDLFVLVSPGEGMSNALLEAMAGGLPVVVSRVSGNVDVVEDGVNGLLVGPGDAAGLARAMERILDEPELAAAMGRNNREKVLQNYRLDIIAKRYLELYHFLVAGKGS